MPRQREPLRYSVAARAVERSCGGDRMTANRQPGPRDRCRMRTARTASPAPPSCWSCCWPSPGASTGSPRRWRCAKCRPGACALPAPASAPSTLFAAAIAHRPQFARAARRARARHGRRLSQRRGVSDPVGLRAIERRDLARHHHHLFDADLDHDAQPSRARRTAERRSAWWRSACAWPGLTILVWPLFADRLSALRVLFARLRAELGLRHRLHQMGEGHDRAAGQRGLAIAVRLSVHCRRHVRVRRLSASVAAAHRDDAGGAVCRRVRRRARAFPVVVDRRPAAGHHRLARLAAGAGDRRHRFGYHSRRAADRARHHRLRDDLRGGGLRAAAAERASTRRCRSDAAPDAARRGGQRQAAGRGHGAGLGLQLGRRPHHPGSAAAVDHARGRHRARRPDAVCRRRHHRRHACRSARRALQDPDRRIFQRRGLQRLLGLCAGLRHHLARHRHRLFDADLVGAAGAFRAQGKAQRR